MKVLITAGTGKLGKEITNRLLKRGHEPVIMTHDLTHLRDLPMGIEGILGDFENPEGWEEVLKGIDKVCLITPSILDEAKFGTDFVKFVVQHPSIKQVVLLSIYNAEAGSHIPHFFAKLEMEEVLKKSEIPYTIIRANNYFQNDELYISGMEKAGLYLQPIGNVGLNRIDVRDVADAIETALYGSKHLNQIYPLVGAENLTGRKTAAIYSELLNKKISYPENALYLWENQLRGKLPDWQIEEYKMMYEFFLIDGLGARGDAHEKREKILEKAPRRFEDYARELIKQNSSQFESWNSQNQTKGKGESRAP